MVKRKNHRKWLWWGIGLILVVGLVIVGVLIWQNSFNFGGDENLEVEKAEATKQDENDSSEEEEISQFKEEDGEKKTVQYEGEDPNMKEELSGSITYAGVLDNKIIIRVNIDQYLSGGGCELSLINGNNIVYSDNANIISSASTATCEGFDIPSSNIGSGNYNIIITLNSNEKKGTIRGEIKI